MARRKKAGKRTPVGPGVRAVLRLLSSDLRRQAIVQLALGPSDVTTLAEHVGWPIARVSGSLTILREAGLVQVEQCAHQRIYSLAKCFQVAVAGRTVRLTVRTSDGARLVLEVPRG